ncbi:OmpA family protein [Spirillospora sp. NPDC029432]|uniref:OmpA family protein n=1 Tax=Spirillospora sp. NPDC029432 TaxID=3154599 RepID=UPI003455E4A5
MPARRLLVVLAVLTAAAGCTADDSPRKVDPPRAGAAGANAASGGLAREGWYGGADGLHARVEIRALERRGAQTVLRYAVTSLDTAAKSVPFAVSLFDPVGRRLYRPIAAGTSPAPSGPGVPSVPTVPTSPGVPTTPTAPGATTTPGAPGEPLTARAEKVAYAAPTPSGSTSSSPSATPSTSASGSASPSPSPSQTPTPTPPVPSPAVEQFAPGVTRELAAGFPAVPATTGKLTVLVNGTAGEFTGVPVTGTAAAAATAATPGNPVDLYDVTEGATKDVIAGNTDVKVNLRADALFAKDSAKLSGRAKELLDQAGQELRQKADPAKGPITISGHTDSEGADAANLKLSSDRAKAVEKELKSRLGGSYTYTAQGRGEAELIAKEGGTGDAAARSRNRRVEIAYIVRQPAAGTASSASPAAPASPAAGSGRPADFRAEDGSTVASRSATFAGAKRRIDVKPFYRDGAYLVAVFDIVNQGPGTTPPDAVYPHKDYLGGAFTAFSVRVKGGTDVYRAVRIGPPAANSATYVDPGRATFRTAVNTPARGFVYVPAPPGNVTSVVFDAGPFGKIDAVPVS